MQPTDPFDVSFDHETIKRRSLNGAAATFVGQALKFALQFGSTLALTRLLEPAEFGLIALVAPLLGFVKIFNDLGFGQAVVQRADITQAQVSAVFWLNMATSAGLTALVMLAAPLVGWLYGDPRVVPVILALAPLIMIFALTILPNAVLNRHMRFLPLAFIDVAAVAIGVVVAVACAWAGLGVWSLVLSQLANGLTWPVFSWSFARWRPSRPAIVPGVGSLVRFGANLTWSNLATYVAMSADNILVGVVDGKVALGFYDRSYTLVVQPLAQVMAPVSRLAVPLLSRLTQTPERFRSAYLRMLQMILLAATPGLLCNIFLADPIIRLLFGPKWADTAPVFAWICAGGLAVAVNASAGWLFTSQDRTREQAIFFTINSVISVASFAIGVIWGVLGVALCSAATFALVQTPLLIWAATRTGAVRLPDIGRMLAPFVLASAAAALALQVTQLDRYGIGGLLASGALSYATFALVLLCLPGGAAFFSGLRDLAATLRGNARGRLGAPLHP